MTGAPRARIAFVGAGDHATGSLYPNLPLIPECELVAVCDLDEQRARDTARRYGAPHWFTDVDAMLAAVELDGCCICGPPAVHYAVGLQVLRHGVPIFVEKPPAPSLAEAITLAETAASHGTWGMVGFMKRFAPANVLAKEFIDSPEFGTLSSLTVMHGAGPYDSLRRMLFMNGIHMIDLARFLGGDIERIFAYKTEGAQRNLAVAATGVLTNGGVVQLNINSGHTWSDCYEAVYVTGAQHGVLIDASREVEVMHAGARFAPGEGLHLHGFRARHTVSGNMAGWWAGGHYQRGYWGELSHFVRACAGIVAPDPTLAEGVKAVAIVDALIESSTHGQEVWLEQRS